MIDPQAKRIQIVLYNLQQVQIEKENIQHTLYVVTIHVTIIILRGNDPRRHLDMPRNST